jgi:hypothetical protein
LTSARQPPILSSVPWETGDLKRVELVLDLPGRVLASAMKREP